MHSFPHSRIANTNTSGCHPPPLPESFRNHRGKKTCMVLAFREYWSPGPPSPAPDLAVNIHRPQAVHNLCHARAVTNRPPLSQRQRGCESAAAEGWLLGSWDPANMDLALLCFSRDNPGTERYAFTQMFSPPHSSHLPRSSSASSSSPGFPHPQTHSSGVFCTDFLSLLSRD